MIQVWRDEWQIPYALRSRNSHRLSSTGTGDRELEEVITLQVLNEHGALVDEVTDSQLQEHFDSAFRVMKNLLEAARYRAMGVDEALDGLLESLDDE